MPSLNVFITGRQVDTGVSSYQNHSATNLMGARRKFYLGQSDCNGAPARLERAIEEGVVPKAFEAVKVAFAHAKQINVIF